MDEHKPTSRISSVLNKAATKEYILEQVKKIRIGWNCNRVAGEALDFYQAHVESTLRQVAIDVQPRQDLPDYDDDRLLIWSLIKSKLHVLWQAKMTWMTIAKIDNLVCRHLEDRLRAKIKADIQGHPSVGQTFKP